MNGHQYSEAKPDSIILPNSGVNAFSKWDLDRALQDVLDLLERCMLPFILLGNTARTVKEDNLSVEEITVGVLEKQVTPEVISTLKTFNVFPVEDGFEYKYNNIPIKIKVIKKKWKFLENPDTVFYGVDNYQIPNPFDKYWHNKQLVR